MPHANEKNGEGMSQNPFSCVMIMKMNLNEFTIKIIPMRTDVLAQARRLTGDDNDAEDLAQEVMLKLWTMRDTLDTHPNARALAFTILRNLHTDLWRRRQRAAQAGDWPPIDESDFAEADSHDEMALIRLIMEHLPPLQRQIMRMKEIEGYSGEEIQQITGCSADGIRQNLSRARRRIREDYMKLTKRRK
jgi:RNA polymerase sigma factor (sigma-70 family)